MNPFVEASVTAYALCVRLGFATDDDKAIASKSLRGLRTALRDLFAGAEVEGILETVVANFNDHVANDDEARVRETAKLLVTGYREMLELFRN